MGLTTGACFAHLGHVVVCVDNDLTRLEQIKSCAIPIYEVGLDHLVTESIAKNLLSFSSNPSEAVRDADFVFLCLPTPSGEDGKADVSAVIQVAAQIGSDLKGGSVVVNKSTVPVNSAAVVSQLINRPDVAVVSNPEFLREGSAVDDFLNPDRIVIGCIDESAGWRVAELYSSARCPVLLTDPVSAETIKYMANAFLAMKVSFVNEVASYCHVSGGDVLEVMRGLSLDPRIGARFLSPGPGWGGSCFPKDTVAIAASARSLGLDLGLVDQTIVSNRMHQGRVVQFIEEAVGSSVGIPQVSILGLAFKAGTNDTRESPAVALATRLFDRGYKVRAFDPVALAPANSGIEQVFSLEAALTDADVVVIATEWKEFGAITPDMFKMLMRRPVVVDLRHVLDARTLREVGIDVRVLGRQY